MYIGKWGMLYRIEYNALYCHYTHVQWATEHLLISEDMWENKWDEVHSSAAYIQKKYEKYSKIADVQISNQVIYLKSGLLHIN